MLFRSVALFNLILMTVCVALGLTGIMGIGILVALVIVIIAIVIISRAMKFRSQFARDQKLVGADIAVKTDK